MGEYVPLDRRRKKQPIVPARPETPLPRYVQEDWRRQHAQIDADLTRLHQQPEDLRIRHGVGYGLADALGRMLSGIGSAIKWLFKEALGFAILLGFIGCIIFGLAYLFR